MSFEIFTYGNPDAAAQLVQMVDDHDLSLIEREAAFIRELSGGQDFGLKAVKVNDWNKDLSPWPAPAVFGNEDFGEGAVVGRISDGPIRRDRSGVAINLVSGICGIHAWERDAAARGLSEPWRSGGKDEKPGDVTGGKRDPAGLRRAAGSGSGVRAGVEQRKSLQGCGSSDGEGVRVADEEQQRSQLGAQLWKPCPKQGFRIYS